VFRAEHGGVDETEVKQDEEEGKETLKLAQYVVEV
jgi:hypothetical protein